MKNTRIFYLEIFPFLVVKLSIYLNRRVFVMEFVIANYINEPGSGTKKKSQTAESE